MGVYGPWAPYLVIEPRPRSQAANQIDGDLNVGHLAEQLADVVFVDYTVTRKAPYGTWLRARSVAYRIY